eukprot:TRINITY_DN5661_c2_g1_i1.p1 TRINITY_DN5661_c2_g1~~TRINITY_DN5661_c2_g1_i1.p1  ORF type:complete len:502 (-),score=116.25 TRINITY_DN5661_c2_g1_i1:221-1726(-)
MRTTGVLGLLCTLPVWAEAKISLFPAPGIPITAYDKLIGSLRSKLGAVQGLDLDGSGELCVSHSVEAASSALATASKSEDKRCNSGLILLAAAPSQDELRVLPGSLPLLVIAGSLDGVVPFSRFAASWHQSKDMLGKHFVVIRGASHMSFASGVPSAAATAFDLQPLLEEEKAHAAVTKLVHLFLSGDKEALELAKLEAAKLASPLVEALKLEGSTALGHVACNSDFPTNPTCNYPKWPDHSLPFGPAPAPNPPLPSDCICGSDWVANTAAPMMAGLPDSVSMFAKDAFHDVADVHPFHLPHIFNSCNENENAPCVLNTTTLTMPVVKPGSLWPSSNSSVPLSALELRSKLKSREATYSAAGLASAADLDKDMKLCANINAKALEWALNHAEPDVKEHFTSKGEPLVIVDDKKATIGATGPEWIKDELVFNRVPDTKSPTGSRVEVQSWMFVVGNANNGKVPWFVPVGMHYCKLLSPARVMEWIYTDGLRSHKNSKSSIFV